MNFRERKRKILEAVAKSESLTVLDLSEKVGSSTATIRRDLHALADEGLLIRTHGGAMKLEDRPLTAFVKKQGVNESRKQEIGRLAASCVREGDILFMDCGSTVFTMCAHLKKMSRLTVITNSLPVMAELMESPGIRINVVGGELDRERRAVHGDKALFHIDSYHADKAFVGVDGLSLENGLSAFSEKEASMTRAFAKNAKSVYLLCDSSKIGKDAYLRFGSLSMVDFLVTDPGLPEAAKDGFIQMKVNVLSGDRYF